MSYYELWSDVVYLYLSIIILYINIISSYHHHFPSSFKKYGASSLFSENYLGHFPIKTKSWFLFFFPPFLLPRVCCVVCYQIFLFFPLSPLSLQNQIFTHDIWLFWSRKKRKKLVWHTSLNDNCSPTFFLVNVKS